MGLDDLGLESTHERSHGFLYGAVRATRMFWTIEWVIALIAILIVVIVTWAAVNDSKKKARFMEECLQDHKQYECDVMWRQAQPNSTFIYMPMGSR